MQSVKREKVSSYLEIAALAVFFVIAVVLCTTIQYTDGDDSYFYQMAHSMKFFDYLEMRYTTWEGRMTSEAMTYISMYLGKAFWNVANGAMLTLLVAGLVSIVKKICKELTAERKLLLTLFMCLGILLMGVEVVGYAAFWITGSTFYLWSVTAGVWAAVPLAELVFSPDTLRWKSFLYAIPCGFIAAMGQEQIAAVVITFAILAVSYHYVTARKLHWLAGLQTFIMIAALIILFISPGTEERSLIEIQLNMPEFADMPVGQHLFITGQWILSGFANYHRYYISAMLVLLAVLLVMKQRSGAGSVSKSSQVLTIAALVAAAGCWLSVFGITALTELGTGYVDNTVPLTKAASLSSISGAELFACIWQLLVVVLLLALLWQVGESIVEKLVLVLMLLAGIGSAAVMYFSPTMYASGPRVMFMMAVMLWLILGILIVKTKNLRIQIGMFVYVAAAGMVNLAGAANIVTTFLGKK